MTTKELRNEGKNFVIAIQDEDKIFSQSSVRGNSPLRNLTKLLKK